MKRTILISLLTFTLSKGFTQNLTNCLPQIVDLNLSSNGWELVANVNLVFESNCGCPATGDCKLLRINIPSNFNCQGLFVRGVEKNDSYDIYKTDCTEYIDSYFNGWGQNANNWDYLYSFDTQQGGSQDILICKGSDFVANQNSIDLNISSSDLCYEVNLPDCCPVASEASVQETSSGYASYDFGGVYFPASCSNAYVQLVKGIDGTVHGDGAILPFPCGRNELILEINSNGIISECPFVLNVNCNSSCEGCFEYQKSTGDYNNNHGPLSLSSRSSMKKYTDVFLKNEIQYVGSSFGASNPDVEVFINNQSQIKLSGEKGESVSEIYVDDTDDLYLTGSFASSTINGNGVSLNNFDPDNTTYDAFVCKWENDNYDTPQWAFSYGGSFQDVPEDFYQINDNEFVVVGTSYNCVDFDGHPVRVKMSCDVGEVKAYIAKYTENGTAIPTCDWVRTVELDQRGNLSAGLGVTGVGNRIFVSGSYNNRSDRSDLLKVKNENCTTSNNAQLTVNPKTHSGYLAEFDLNGKCNHLIQIGIEDFKSQWFLDIELQGNNLFGVGNASIGKYDIANGITPIEFHVIPQNNLIELATNEQHLLVIGWTGTKTILSKYDINKTLEEPICTIHPGQHAFSRGASISHEKDKIAVAISTSHDQVKVHHPEENNTVFPNFPISASTLLRLFNGVYTICDLNNN